MLAAELDVKGRLGHVALVQMVLVMMMGLRQNHAQTML